MSMQHIITSAVKPHKRTQRKGRGDSSGRGKTCGRGGKGASARQGTYIRRGYEGGQTEVYRRFPKRGFSNFKFERRFHIVNLAELERFDSGTTVDQNALIEAGLVPDDKQPVKILGDGTLTKKLTTVVGWYSRSAHDAITRAGGVAQNVKGEPFAFPKPKKVFVPREKPKKKAVDEAPEGEKAEAKAPKAEKPEKAEKPGKQAE